MSSFVSRRSYVGLIGGRWALPACLVRVYRLPFQSRSPAHLPGHLSRNEVMGSYWNLLVEVCVLWFVALLSCCSFKLGIYSSAVEQLRPALTSALSRLRNFWHNVHLVVVSAKHLSLM